MSLQDKLTQIKNRADAATEGPWSSDKIEAVSSLAGGLKWVSPLQDRDDEPLLAPDAHFIAHARTDIPKLLQVIERLIEQRNEFCTDEAWANMEDADAELKKLLEGQ